MNTNTKSERARQRFGQIQSLTKQKNVFKWQNLCQSLNSKHNFSEIQRYGKIFGVPPIYLDNPRKICSLITPRVSDFLEKVNCDNEDEPTMDGDPVGSIPEYLKYTFKAANGKTYCYNIVDLYKSLNSQKKDPYRRFDLDKKSIIERYEYLKSVIEPRGLGTSILDNIRDIALQLSPSSILRNMLSEVYSPLRYPKYSLDEIINASEEILNGLWAAITTQEGLNTGITNQERRIFSDANKELKLKMLVETMHRLITNDDTQIVPIALELAINNSVLIQNQRTNSWILPYTRENQLENFKNSESQELQDIWQKVFDIIRRGSNDSFLTFKYYMNKNKILGKLTYGSSIKEFWLSSIDNQTPQDRNNSNAIIAFKGFASARRGVFYKVGIFSDITKETLFTSAIPVNIIDEDVSLSDDDISDDNITSESDSEDEDSWILPDTRENQLENFKNSESQELQDIWQKVFDIIRRGLNVFDLTFMYYDTNNKILGKFTHGGSIKEFWLSSIDNQTPQDRNNSNAIIAFKGFASARRGVFYKVGIFSDITKETLFTSAIPVEINDSSIVL